MRGPNARWLQLGELPPDLDRPAVWLVRNDDPVRMALVNSIRPDATDLADAALFRSPARSADRLARRLLLKALVARYAGVTEKAVQVEREPAGGLRVSAPLALFTSVSAGGGCTMMALAQAPVGVDAERAEAETPLPLAVLSAEEANLLAGLPSADQRQEFSRLWTVKEAALKALGVGLARNPADVSVRFEADLARVDLGSGQYAIAEVRTCHGITAAVALIGS